MSVPTSTGRYQYTLSSGAQALPVPFYFLEDTHLKVIRKRTGVTDLTLVKGTDYTVSGAGDESGGTVTTIAGTAAALAAGDIITIKRDIPITQLVNYVYNDKFPAEVHEKALDKLTMVTQQLKEVADRSVQFPETEVAGTGNFLPEAAGRAGKILGFDTLGNASLFDPASAVFTTGDGIETSNIAALKAVLVASLVTGQQARTAGFGSSGDGGAGLFYYDSASAATADDATVVAPSVGSGRWIRLIGEGISVKAFGAKGDNLTNDTAAIQKAIAYCNANGVALLWPKGTYLCNALTQVAGRVDWIGYGEVWIKKFSGTVDVLYEPNADVQLENIGFDGYFRAFQGSGVAAGSQWVAERCRAQNFTANAAATSTNGGLFAAVSPGGNALRILRVHGCTFKNMHMAIMWRNPADRVSIQDNTFESIEQIAVWIGETGYAHSKWTRVNVSGNAFKNIFPTSVTSSEIHAILVYGLYVEVSGNNIDTVVDNHGSVHDAEAIYVKASFFTITCNNILNGGRGDGMIVAKGGIGDDVATTVSTGEDGQLGIIANNVLALTAAFESTYSTASALSGIYFVGTNILVTGNIIRASLNRAIENGGGGACVISNNYIRATAAGDKGISVTSNYLNSGMGKSLTIVGNSVEGFDTAIRVQIQAGLLERCLVANNNLSTVSSTSIRAAIRFEMGQNTTVGNVGTINALHVVGNVMRADSGGSAGGAGVVILTDFNSGFGTANNGVISLVSVHSNEFYRYDNPFRVTASGVARAHLGNNLGVSVGSWISNWNLITNMKVDALRGDRIGTARGVATIASGATEVTVSHNINSEFAIQSSNGQNFRVTPLSNIGSATKWWVPVADFGASTFKIKVDAAPGADIVFGWEVDSMYH